MNDSSKKGLAYLGGAISLRAVGSTRPEAKSPRSRHGCLYRCRRDRCSREKFWDFFAFFWSRLALQPENGCKPFDRPARERTGCIQNINS
ncbi:MAG: hypothetical protein DME40_03555 [Verrucomicrobia bacterium]|nr:MAG: hypothetical protein DME40_03555 [Verrucomicrobiota bacterium]